MKVINVNPGILPIPPNGWGAVEKIIWDYHQEMANVGVRSEIKYLDEIKYDDSMVVHVHVANLANVLHERGIPYIFSIHDHHAYVYGKDSSVFKENLKAIENSVFSLSPCKFLIPYFGSKKLRYFSHAVNTNIFKFNGRQVHTPPKLLCVANNGYAYDQTVDRKGFKIAIEAAMQLDFPITIAGPSNNKNFFNTLPEEINSYSKLTKLYDLDEKWLVHLYNDNDIFLHFSELEAGHPNLTLLEAMACGLPVVGTFEDTAYKGMFVTNRTVEEAVNGIKKVSENYESYRKDALENASENSYSSRVIDLTKLYSEYREQIFANRIISHYETSEKIDKDIKNKIRVWFPRGPKVEILGPSNKKYKAKFFDADTNKLVFESSLGNNMWASASKKYYSNWKIEIHEVVSDTWEMLIETHTMNLERKNVKVIFDTNSLGDIIAYIGATDAFQKKHNCNLTCVVYNEEIIELFGKNYKNIKFSKTNDSDDDYYATYCLGYYDQNNWEGNVRENPKRMSLATMAASILGLPEVETPPELDIVPTKHNKKYVCIATQSTAQAKYWNNPLGWKKVVEYIKSKGYEVWCIDLHSSFGIKNQMNYIPNGAVDKTGKLPLQERLSQIAGAEFFIGLGSGLSWVAWAAKQKIILISGFSEIFAEFFTPYRVINDTVCHGCWNDVNCTFDKNNWNWCPRNKNFECTKNITSDMVIKQVDKILNKSLDGIDWGLQPVSGKFMLFHESFGDSGSVYEKIFKVEKGDVVLDIGAHVGLFSVVAKKRGASKIVAVEPSKLRLDALKRNLEGVENCIIPYGISEPEVTIPNGLIYDGLVEDFSGIPFKKLLESSGLNHIDFMKVDCEGGEYDIFSMEYIDWIKNNVKKISGEWHITNNDQKSKFIFFRDNILTKYFKKYEVYSVDGVDIKWQFFTDSFANSYFQFFIYIDNRE